MFIARASTGQREVARAWLRLTAGRDSGQRAVVAVGSV